MHHPVLTRLHAQHMEAAMKRSGSGAPKKKHGTERRPVRDCGSARRVVEAQTQWDTSRTWSRAEPDEDIVQDLTSPLPRGRELKPEDLTIDFYTSWHTLRVQLTTLRGLVRERLRLDPKSRDPLVTRYLRGTAVEQDVRAAHTRFLADTEDPALRDRLLAVDRQFQDPEEPMDVMTYARALRQRFEEWVQSLNKDQDTH